MIERTVDTAVIPIAGLGTRMAPFTAGEPKFMAGISEGDRYRPNIDYTLDDCVAAGIKNLIFVVSNGGDEVLRGYLGPVDPGAYAQYDAAGKQKILEADEARRAVFADMNIEYVEQDLAGKYGTAIPLSLARSALQGVEHFAVTGGDDFVWHKEGASELTLAVRTWRDAGTDMAIMGKPVSRNEAPKYGILQTDVDGHLVSIDEKPPLERVPELPMANISRYILSHEIWPHVDDLLARPREAEQPEYYITDVINNAVAAGNEFQVHRVQGVYLDAGSPQGILQASAYLTEQVTQA